MKKLLFLVVALFWLLPERGEAQITIHPEVGVSYLPFKTAYINNINIEVKNIDFLFGVSAELPFNKKWFMRTRFSFSNRKDFDRSFSTFSSTFYQQYDHCDLNVDITAKYKINSHIDLGGGPSLIKSFGILETYEMFNEEIRYNSYRNLGKIYFALNGGVSLNINRFKIHLNYVRIFRFDDYIRYYSMERGTSGCNRLDLTVSYHLLGGDKEKKR